MNNLFYITNFSMLMLCLDFFFFFFLNKVKFYFSCNLEILIIDFICLALQEGISKFLIFEFGIFKHSNPKFIFHVDIYKSFQNYYFSYYHYESTITIIPNEAITIIVPPPATIYWHCRLSYCHRNHHHLVIVTIIAIIFITDEILLLAVAGSYLCSSQLLPYSKFLNISCNLYPSQ